MYDICVQVFERYAVYQRRFAWAHQQVVSLSNLEKLQFISLRTYMVSWKQRVRAECSFSFLIIFLIIFYYYYLLLLLLCCISFIIYYIIDHIRVRARTPILLHHLHRCSPHLLFFICQHKILKLL